MDPTREGVLRAWDELISAERLSVDFLASLQRRRSQAEDWNLGLDKVEPGRRRRVRWLWIACRNRKLPRDLLSYGRDTTIRERRLTLEAEWRSRSGRRSASIPWALNDIVSGFWAGGEMRFREQ